MKAEMRIVDSSKLHNAFALVANDPSASHWLRRAVRDALARDPVDAWKDADLLARLLKDRVHVVAAVTSKAVA